jgi:hypothetical protein
MSREIYIPIADSFFESSIMQEELSVRFVMLALIRLALRAGANGVVDVDLRTFAGAINLPVKDVERAIGRLMEPDPASASPDEDGRRLVPVDPARPFRNWRLVNWPKYRGIVHRANDAARKRDERHTRENSTDRPDASENVQKRPDVSENGATKTKTKTRDEEEERVFSSPTVLPTTEGEATRKRVARAPFVPPTPKEVSAYALEQGWTRAEWNTHAFVDFFAAKGWITGKTPMKDWRAAARNAHREGWTVKKGNGAEQLTSEEKTERAAASQRLLELAREKLARGEGV